MSDPPAPPSGGGLTPDDLELLAGLGRANDWTRSLLCTLARRGTWLRHHQPDRVEALLTAVAPWPWYKAGQFVFDLFEWEDFMVDGPPPPVFTGPLDHLSVRRVADALRALAATLDPALAAWTEGPASPVVPAVPDADLPPLEPGLHLYRDVVLGLLLTAATPPGRPA